MKALKSQLAKKILAEPKGRELIRSYLANRGVPVLIEVPSDAGGGVIRVTPVTVPKAA
jgi:hypothetical protein